MGRWKRGTDEVVNLSNIERRPRNGFSWRHVFRMIVAVLRSLARRPGKRSVFLIMPKTSDLAHAAVEDLVLIVLRNMPSLMWGSASQKYWRRECCLTKQRICSQMEQVFKQRIMETEDDMHMMFPLSLFPIGARRVPRGEFAKPFGIVKFSREATNFAFGKITFTF